MSDEAKQAKKISIGVGAVIFRGEEVLLIRRARPPFKGRWSIPGGKPDYGESLKDALRREVREETGGEIEILGLIDVFEALPHETAGEELSRHFVLIDFIATWRGGAPVAGDDAAEAAFFPIEEALARLSWDKTRRAVSRAAEIRRAAANPL